MTREELKVLSDDLLKKSLEILFRKGKDYNISEDVFLAFKNAAEILMLTPERICLTYLFKHLDKIVRLVSYEQTAEGEPIQETILDSINYLILLYGMIDEQREDN